MPWNCFASIACAAAKRIAGSLPTAKLLLVEEVNSGFYLLSYGSGGVFAGDSWNWIIEDAKRQAQRAYGGQISTWRDVPPGYTDAATFILSLGI